MEDLRAATVRMPSKRSEHPSGLEACLLPSDAMVALAGARKLAQPVALIVGRPGCSPQTGNLCQGSWARNTGAEQPCYWPVWRKGTRWNNNMCVFFCTSTLWHQSVRSFAHLDIFNRILFIYFMWSNIQQYRNASGASSNPLLTLRIKCPRDNWCRYTGARQLTLTPVCSNQQSTEKLFFRNKLFLKSSDLYPNIRIFGGLRRPQAELT